MAGARQARAAPQGRRLRLRHRRRHRGRRPHRHDDVDGAVAAHRRRGRAAAGARRRRRRPRPADGRRARARLRRRLVRLGLAEDGRERGHARDQGQDVRGRLGRRRAHAHRHRQAVPDAAQHASPTRGTSPARRRRCRRRCRRCSGGARAARASSASRAKEFLTYPVGQIVGDMREETSVRNVVHEMLLELLDSKERLDRLLA